MNIHKKKIFGTLFFAIFSTVTGVGIVVPLLPVYANDLGASGVYIGLIFGAFSLSRTFFLPYFGRRSDINGRKPYIISGLFFYSLISIVFILSSNVEFLIAIRFFQGIASAMIMPVIQAYVGDITPLGKEGTIMGMFNLSMFFGLSLGPLIGGVLKDHYDINLAFACMGILSFISFLAALSFLPPTQSEEIIQNSTKPDPWKNLLSDRNIVGLFFFRFGYTACIGIIWGFLPVYADSKLSLSSTLIGILVMTGVFISGLIHVPMGIIADKTSKKWMVIIGGLITSYAIISFQWADGFYGMLVSSFVFGLGGGMAMPAMMALAVVIGNDTGAMGSVMAIVTMAHSSGMLLGSLLAGFLMDFGRLSQAFSFGGILMAMAIIQFFMLFNANRKPK